MNLPEVDPIHTKLWIVFQFSSCSWGFIIEKKFLFFCGFGLHKVKLQYHMFSSMEIEKYMEYELPGFF